MQTHTLIKDTATVVKMNQLAEGDTYRRLITSDGPGEARVAYGVVTGILSNGSEIALSTVELVKERYSYEYTVEVRVFQADSELALFPGDTSELQSVIAQAQRAAERKVETTKKELNERRQKQAEIEALSDRLAAGMVQANEGEPVEGGYVGQSIES